MRSLSWDPGARVAQCCISKGSLSPAKIIYNPSFKDEAAGSYKTQAGLASIRTSMKGKNAPVSDGEGLFS